MSPPLTETQIDQLSIKHVQRNSKFLKEFFEQIYMRQTIEIFDDPSLLRRFCNAINGLKKTCDTIFKRREVRYPVPARKTAIKPSRLEISTDESQKSSLYYDAPDVTPNAPPPSAEVISSPKTPEKTVFVLPAVNAPMKPTKYRKPQNWEPQEVAFLGITQTPRRKVTTSTPHRAFTPQDDEKSFRVTIESPDFTSIRKIEGDSNVSSGDIEKVNKIVGNISQSVGTDVAANNTVILSTRNVMIMPGKYELFKVNSIRL